MSPELLAPGAEKPTVSTYALPLSGKTWSSRSHWFFIAAGFSCACSETR